MRESTKRVYSEVEKMHRRYFGKGRVYESIVNGTFEQRTGDFERRAWELHKEAETEAAHKRIDAFIMALTESRRVWKIKQKG